MTGHCVSFRLGILASVVVLAACVDAGVEPVSFPLAVRGADARTFEGRDGWQVELVEAEILFGPLYLCAGPQAGELCDAARAEFLGSVRIDALEPTPIVVGQVEGLSGTVRSAMWDYGRPWPLGANEPLVGGEGSSVRVRGTARRGALEVPFDVALDLAASRAGVVLVRASALFEEKLADGRALTVNVNPSEWLDEVQWEDVVDGGFPPGSQPARSLINALSLRSRPLLAFDEE